MLSRLAGRFYSILSWQRRSISHAKGISEMLSNEGLGRGGKRREGLPVLASGFRCDPFK